MKKQRGQAVVEFALVLPIFLALVFSIIVCGMLFADYMTLSNVARSSAREAALQGSEKYADIRTNYRSSTKLLSNLYTWPDDDTNFDIAAGELDDSVQVTITTTLNPNFPGVSVVKNGYFNSSFPPDTYTIKYSMHDEATNASGN
ncbi:MAG: pilus assembly protein [Selenomonadaceae bacterium]|nr:pilus assembly protein [Selenomonadaceae bacterium]